MKDEKEISVMSCVMHPSRRFGQKYQKGFFDALKWVLEERKENGEKGKGIKKVSGLSSL